MISTIQAYGMPCPAPFSSERTILGPVHQLLIGRRGSCKEAMGWELRHAQPTSRLHGNAMHCSHPHLLTNKMHRQIWIIGCETDFLGREQLTEGGPQADETFP